VLRWNQATLDAITFDATSPTFASRGIAMVHAAIYDAVAAIEGQPGYYTALVPPSGASLEAAVSGAAFNVLKYLYPGQQTYLSNTLQAAISQVSDGTAKDSGLAF